MTYEPVRKASWQPPPQKLFQRVSPSLQNEPEELRSASTQAHYITALREQGQSGVLQAKVNNVKTNEIEHSSRFNQSFAHVPVHSPDVLMPEWIQFGGVEAQRHQPARLPEPLRAGIESLSGMAMDDVQVHYNSSQPNELDALASAQGTHIHVASGQEKHLPHEAWHVVQQAQGRVKPTWHEQGIPINDEPELEQEADVMGRKAAQIATGYTSKNLSRRISDVGTGQQGTRSHLRGLGTIAHGSLNHSILPAQLLNKKQQTTFRTFAQTNLERLRSDLKTGEERGVSPKEDNYRNVVSYLQENQFKTDETTVNEAVEIIKDVMKRELEVQKPPQDNGAARKLETLKAGASAVTADINGVDVRLDNDQLKHQHPTVPIGTRTKGGGNRFVVMCDAAWHQANTMQHMADWAADLDMEEGQQLFHGQATPVNGIHYEGFCLLAKGKKYVLFHCYPANSSDLKL